MDACRILLRQLPIKIVRYNQRKRTRVLLGNENRAIAVFVAKFYQDHIGSRRLKRTMNAFGMTEYKKTYLKKKEACKIHRLNAKSRL